MFLRRFPARRLPRARAWSGHGQARVQSPKSRRELRGQFQDPPNAPKLGSVPSEAMRQGQWRASSTTDGGQALRHG